MVEHASKSASETSLAKAIAAALSELRPDVREPLDRLAPLYADDVRFADPIQEVRGRQAFLEMNHRLLDRARHLRFIVHHRATSPGVICLTWSLELQPKMGPQMGFEGASQLLLRTGQVIDHRDYWDLLGGVMDAAGPLGSVYRRLVSMLG